MTQEMGKPITQAEGEIDKCISHIQYYIDNTERFLADEELDIMNPNNSGIITHQPLGPTLGKFIISVLHTMFTNMSNFSDHALEFPLLASIQVVHSYHDYGQLYPVETQSVHTLVRLSN